jgi:hypothetical protein
MNTTQALLIHSQFEEGKIKNAGSSTDDGVES